MIGLVKDGVETCTDSLFGHRHVVDRFDLEWALVAKDMAAMDRQAAWNEKCRATL